MDLFVIYQSHWPPSAVKCCIKLLRWPLPPPPSTERICSGGILSNHLFFDFPLQLLCNLVLLFLVTALGGFLWLLLQHFLANGGWWSCSTHFIDEPFHHWHKYVSRYKKKVWSRTSICVVSFSFCSAHDSHSVHSFIVFFWSIDTLGFRGLVQVYSVFFLPLPFQSCKYSKLTRSTFSFVTGPRLPASSFISRSKEKEVRYINNKPEKNNDWYYLHTCASQFRHSQSLLTYHQRRRWLIVATTPPHSTIMQWPMDCTSVVVHPW